MPTTITIDPKRPGRGLPKLCACCAEPYTDTTLPSGFSMYKRFAAWYANSGSNSLQGAPVPYCRTCVRHIVVANNLWAKRLIWFGTFFAAFGLLIIILIANAGKVEVPAFPIQLLITGAVLDGLGFFFRSRVRAKAAPLMKAGCACLGDVAVRHGPGGLDLTFYNDKFAKAFRELAGC